MNNYYKSVLESLQYLLDSTGVKFWTEWLAEDLQPWEQDNRNRAQARKNDMTPSNWLIACR